MRPLSDLEQYHANEARIKELEAVNKSLSVSLKKAKKLNEKLAYQNDKLTTQLDKKVNRWK